MLGTEMDVGGAPGGGLSIFSPLTFLRSGADHRLHRTVAPATSRPTSFRLTPRHPAAVCSAPSRRGRALR